MLHVIGTDTHLAHGSGPFRIARIRPGHGVDHPEHPGDTGFGPLGLVDRASLSPGLLVPMHEHVDDEIVSYLRSGTLTHRDSTGREERIGRDRLMVMNAGRGFSHEESIPEATEGGASVEMLQIFIRPREAGLPPRVQFADLAEADRRGRWRRVVAAEGEPAPATVRQDVTILDAHLAAGATIDVPSSPGHDLWLFVFGGRVRIGGGRELAAGEAVAADEGDAIGSVLSTEDADLVLFQLGAEARYTLAGSLSRGR